MVLTQTVSKTLGKIGFCFRTVQGARGEFCPWAARMAAWSELQVLRILAAVVRCQSVDSRPELQLKVAQLAATSITTLSDVRHTLKPFLNTVQNNSIAVSYTHLTLPTILRV